MKLPINKSFYTRLIFYFLFWQIYISFMGSYAPLGIEWLDWHTQRISNFVEFLKLNGYFSNYGFSIWSTCENCSLDKNLWDKNIYLTHLSFSYFPYLLINEFFGNNFFKININFYVFYYKSMDI